MADHNFNVREEQLPRPAPGGRTTEWRVWCLKDDCDWGEKALSEGIAISRGEHHKKMPHLR